MTENTKSPKRTFSKMVRTLAVAAAVTGPATMTSSCAVTPDGTVYTFPAEVNCYGCWRPYRYWRPYYPPHRPWDVTQIIINGRRSHFGYYPHY